MCCRRLTLCGALPWAAGPLLRASLRQPRRVCAALRMLVQRRVGHRRDAAAVRCVPLVRDAGGSQRDDRVCCQCAPPHAPTACACGRAPQPRHALCTARPSVACNPPGCLAPAACCERGVPPAGPLTGLQIAWNGVRALRWYWWLAAGAGAAALAAGGALACRRGCACCAAAAPRVTNNITNITNNYGRARPQGCRVGWEYITLDLDPHAVPCLRAGRPALLSCRTGPCRTRHRQAPHCRTKASRSFSVIYASVPARVQPAAPGTSGACSLGVCSDHQRARTPSWRRARPRQQGRPQRKNGPAAPRRAPRRATCARCTRRACFGCRPAARRAARLRDASGAAAAQMPAPLARTAGAAAAATTTAARPASRTRTSAGTHGPAYSLPFLLKNAQKPV